MIRQIITIDEEKCDGCGICVAICHEGAIGIVDGKAKLLSDEYCDGLGNCLPECPKDAISFEIRDALDFNEDEVQKNTGHKDKSKPKFEIPHGCPNTHAKSFHRSHETEPNPLHPIPTHLNQ